MVELLIRDASPEDAAGIVALFNPIIEAGAFTLFDAPFSVEAEVSYITGLPHATSFTSPFAPPTTPSSAFRACLRSQPILMRSITSA